jgi:hypothetical protein
MPSKVFYAGGAILLRQATTLDEIESCLSGFTIVSRRQESTDWRLSGPSLVIAYKPEANGYVLVDVVDHCWPDQMGDRRPSPEFFRGVALGPIWSGNMARQSQANVRAFVDVAGRSVGSPAAPGVHPHSQQLQRRR